ncbi:hypothetical protein XYCOK13_19290 [Xylanibacillus composti]|uniref:Uncharacterized protein n=1 Tax=Xylanibacillus composti TaxID=1572762 RepID=A0A8J4M1Q8_9BACL|nr:hypothetical protein XYCOK13_19290 [Xylanibacillus composti]
MQVGELYDGSRILEQDEDKEKPPHKGRFHKLELERIRLPIKFDSYGECHAQ